MIIEGYCWVNRELILMREIISYVYDILLVWWLVIIYPILSLPFYVCPNKFNKRHRHVLLLLLLLLFEWYLDGTSVVIWWGLLMVQCLKRCHANLPSSGLESDLAPVFLEDVPSLYLVRCNLRSRVLIYCRYNYVLVVGLSFFTFVSWWLVVPTWRAVIAELIRT